MAFKQNDPIIWDSGDGYDIGLYKHQSTGFLSSIQLMSGKACGQNVLVWDEEILPYQSEKAQELARKYKCALKQFATAF